MCVCALDSKDNGCYGNCTGQTIKYSASDSNKMPIFHKKSTSKPVPRLNRLPHCPKFQEDIEDYKHITLTVNGKEEIKFVDGVWQGIGGKANDDVKKLKEKFHAMEEENNLNRIKVEVLLDMLAEIAAETYNKDGQPLMLTQ